jgi:hypothetical protein
MPRKAKKARRARAPAYSDFRRLSPAENEREGFSRKARRYVLKSVRKLTKRTPTISARQHETLRTRQEYGYARPEIATEARKHGALSYKTGTTQETATKVSEKAYLKKLENGVAQAAQSGARIAEYSGPGSKKKQTFKARRWHAGEVTGLRARKLSGEELTQSEFSMLMDYSERFKDPMRALLRQSPGSFNPRITPNE